MQMRRALQALWRLFYIVWGSVMVKHNQGARVCLREGTREWKGGKETEFGSVTAAAAVCACLCVCGVTAICEHVYAPLSLNLYMFE